MGNSSCGSMVSGIGDWSVFVRVEWDTRYIAASECLIVYKGGRSEVIPEVCVQLGGQPKLDR